MARLNDNVVLIAVRTSRELRNAFEDAARKLQKPGSMLLRERLSAFLVRAGYAVQPGVRAPAHRSGALPKQSDSANCLLTLAVSREYRDALQAATKAHNLTVSDLIKLYVQRVIDEALDSEPTAPAPIRATVNIAVAMPPELAQAVRGYADTQAVAVSHILRTAVSAGLAGELHLRPVAAQSRESLSCVLTPDEQAELSVAAAKLGMVPASYVRACALSFLRKQGVPILERFPLSQAAEMLGVKAETLRAWIGRGSVPAPHTDGYGPAWYSANDIQAVELAIQARHQVAEKPA